MPRYGDWWMDLYSSSSSGDSSCQLCHSRAGGGNGWNSYGWEARTLFRLSGSFGTEENRFKFALLDIEDFIVNGNTFINEIDNNEQPGWSEGLVNSIYYSSGNPEIALPPSDLPCGVKIDQTSSFTCEVERPNEPIAQGNVAINFEVVSDGLTDPVLALSSPDSSDNGSLYVIERSGSVWRVNLETGIRTEFLDFGALLPDVENLGERGLLGFAFDPNYSVNNLVYTYLSKPVNGEADFSTLGSDETADHQTIISKWLVDDSSANSTVALSEVEMLKIDQPQENHNGGDIHFGPDGYLYIALGDGGNAFDQGVGHGENGNARDNSNPLGAILRIDPHANNSANSNYGIPANNPFVGINNVVEEVYAYGFRNPYRFSIDELVDGGFQLYVADVGQNNIEEVNRIDSSSVGGNFGWNYKEGSYFLYMGEAGSFVSETAPSNIVIPPLIDPIAQYDHDEGISVIGGHVYTGSEVEGLQRTYVFGEFGNPRGRLMYLSESDQIQEFQYESSLNMRVTGFGKDQMGELYVVGISLDAGEGVVKKIVSGKVQDFCFPIKSSSGKFDIICL